MVRYIGIVGHGDNKFDINTKAAAIEKIIQLLSQPDVGLVSGHAPVGGIDIWAEDIADQLKIPKKIFAPAIFKWNPPGQYGFKARNLDIAKFSDEVLNIVVQKLPEGYTGPRYYDYHCKDSMPSHIKSGGCWTALQARKLGKPATWIIL